MIVGIDLGTTYSLVAAMRDGAPVVLPNVVGEVLTPSAVSVDADGEIIVGAAARARATTHPDRTALSFKRDMGTRKKLSLGPHELSPPELSALVLRSLKQDAEAVLGATVDEAVVTVPAYFGDAQRQATRDAGEIAGLRVDRIINEPTAAALAYGLQNRSRDLRAVVLDLGGGTFDVSVLEIVDGVVEIHASAGDTRLGGDDFDDALAKALLQRIAARHGIEPKLGRASAARLRRAAELLKMRLGRADEARVALHALEVGKKTLDVELDVTRAEAESAWRHCLDRLDGPVHRALLEAKVEPRAIDEVLLVGGATRMPAVVERATRMFGRQPRTDLPPDEAVALGAAVQAALKSRDASVGDMVVADVAPFSLGIAQAAYVGANIVRGMFAPLITRGTTIPASALRRFSTAEDFQGLLRIEVFQGEHSVCASNTRLGDVVVNVPKRRAGEEKVDVRFTYDLNGILEVDTTVVSSGKKTTLVFEQGEGRMSRLEVVEARIRMQALKLRPRAMLVNLVALERGEALHVELRGERRAALAAHLGALRAALDADDLGDVDVARAQLLALLEVLRSEWDLV